MKYTTIRDVKSIKRLKQTSPPPHQKKKKECLVEVCRYALRHILTIGYMQNKYRIFYKIYTHSWLYADKIETHPVFNTAHSNAVNI